LCLQAALKKFHEVSVEGNSFCYYEGCYSQVNGALPEKIIVFRDGVGDGDMKLVSEFEVPQFFEGFSMFGKQQLIVYFLTLISVSTVFMYSIVLLVYRAGLQAKVFCCGRSEESECSYYGCPGNVSLCTCIIKGCSFFITILLTTTLIGCYSFKTVH